MLEYGKTYRFAGALSPDLMEASQATPAGLKKTLESEGFIYVSVVFDSAQLPEDWGEERKEDLRKPGSSDVQVYMQATWSKPTVADWSPGGAWRDLVRWEYAPKVSCGSEGYSCAVDSPSSGCCGGLECRWDWGNKYGLPGGAVGPRCMVPFASPPPATSNAGWWVLGIVGVAVAGGVAWWVTRRMHNPLPWYAPGERYEELAGFSGVYARVTKHGRVAGIVDTTDNAPNFAAWEEELQYTFGKRMKVDRVAEALENGDAYHAVSGG